MKVMLIFPPDWFPSEPYLSLPSLTSVLRQAGHTGHSERHQPRNVRLVLQRGLPQEGPAPGATAVGPPPQTGEEARTECREMDVQFALCDLTRQRIDELIKKAEQAKRIIRGENFYEIDKLEWAIHVFREVT